MKHPFNLILAAIVAVIMLCASDSSTTWPDPAPRVRLHHRTADSIAADPAYQDMARAQEALRVLIQTHPRIEISRDLNRLIEDEVVVLNFQDSLTGDLGLFASTMLLTTEDGSFLTLSVSPTLLLDESRHERQQLVIYHEYIHLRQALDGTVPAWTFTPRGAADITEEYLRYFLAAEMEAYEAECDFADEIRSEETLQLCVVRDHLGRQAMREAFAWTLIGDENWREASDLVMRIAREP